MGRSPFTWTNQAEIDKYLEDTEREFEGNAIPLSEENPTLWERLHHAKAQNG